jgi:hypothetical protein
VIRFDSAPVPDPVPDPVHEVPNCDHALEQVGHAAVILDGTLNHGSFSA